MTVTLVTVPDVELVSTGTYQLASGEATFSAENLADAVAAAQDATVTAPRLKIGHTDPRFAEAVAAGDLDGEPAFGVVRNMRLSTDGQSIIGDYTNVPDWLAASLPSSYPGRSIEGGMGFTAASGKKYSFVITACSLLGITWPGVGSLEDLQEVLTTNGAAPDAGAVGEDAEVEQTVMACVRRTADAITASREVIAGMDIGDVRMNFYGAAESGNVTQPAGAGSAMWWWVRSARVEDDGSLNLIVDDDEGHLMQFPFTVQGQDVTFGEPTMVAEQFVPVAASAAGTGPRILASWPVRAATRPQSPNPTEVPTVRLNGVEVDAGPLRRAYQLADDADDAAIYEAMGVTPELAPTEPTEPAASTVPIVPDGMTLVDSETWDTVRQGAEQGVAVAARLAQEDRERVIASAIQDGKFSGARREHYEKLWASDEQGARDTISSLATGLIPVQARELGHANPTEGGDNAAAEHDLTMASLFPNEHARLHANHAGRTRIRQEA